MITPRSVCDFPQQKVSGEEKAKVEAEIENTRKALESNNTDTIKEATEKLTKVFYEMSEQLYKNANPNAGAGEQANAGNDGNVYDADYKVEEDNKDDITIEDSNNDVTVEDSVTNEDDAIKIKEEIENGMSFEEAATKYSTCPSKEQGGNLGAFSRGMMVPEFEEAAFGAEIGKVTSPVKTQFGYHIILVNEKNESKVRPFEEVKDSVVQQLIQERQQRKYLDVLKELEAKYGVTRN